MRRTKIVCTLGPSSVTPPALESLMRAGMNVARLNMAHGSAEEHREIVERIRKLSQQIDLPIAIIADTKGPAIRTGRLQNGRVTLHAGQKLVLTEENIVGDSGRISVSYQGLAQHVKSGDRIWLANGEIGLEVQSVRAPEIRCEVKNPGVLGEHKRVSVPGARMPGLLARDEQDIRAAAAWGVDYIAVSFANSRADMERARAALGPQGKTVGLIAKIETREAFERLNEIIAAAAGCMVARGDLGVELPFEEVPLVQKEAIRQCNEAGKPVITATQMLKSMTENPLPTRAEVADVANAILDGTDAIMLSEETAIGSYPAEAVKVMSRIAERIENTDSIYYKLMGTRSSVAEAIGESACQIAARIGASAIITATSSGSTAKLVAKYRPRTPIIAATDSQTTRNKLALVWGVMPVIIDFTKDTDRMIENSIAAAKHARALPSGSQVVITAGVPVGVPGTTNLIKVAPIA